MSYKTRCNWCLGDDLMIEYHDHEWGRPVYDDQLLFEYLVLDGFQAGLSWKTILHKRENFRKAFDGFDPEKVARFGDRKIQSLLQDKGIVRNKLKINGAIKNAQAFLKIQDEFPSFSKYIWQFVDGTPIQHTYRYMHDIPATTPISDRMAKELKSRGFTFCGSTISYAFMQAAGLVNDHITTCNFYKEVQAEARD